MYEIVVTSLFYQYGPMPTTLILVAVSVVCGVFVGYERERKQKPAGIKTMALVCLGSTVFTALSHQMSTDISDPTRIAAQVISGIGFLGAGAVMRGDGYIRGLSTAATIWAVAAIGMVVGFGYPFGGMALSVVTYSVLQGARYLEEKSVGPCGYSNAEITFKNNDGKAIIKILDLLEDYYIYRSDCKFEELSADTTKVSLSYCQNHKHHKSFLLRLTDFEEVQEIKS